MAFKATFPWVLLLIIELVLYYINILFEKIAYAVLTFFSNINLSIVYYDIITNYLNVYLLISRPGFVYGFYFR